MRRLKVFGLSLMAMLAVGIVASASASALVLPTLTLLPGDAFPVTGEGVAKSPTTIKLETVVGSKLTATEAKLLLEWTAAGSEGKFDAHFVGVKEGALPCKTEGDAKEVVLVKGKVALVALSLSPLTVGAAFKVEEFTIECGEPVKVKVKVKGTAIANKVVETLGADVTSLKGNLKCSGKGKQEVKEYISSSNEKGEDVFTKGTLLSNFGLGFEESCEGVEAELAVNTSKMVIING